MPKFRIKPWMVLAAVLLLLVIAFFSTFFIDDGKARGTGAEGVGVVAAPAVSGFNGFAISVREFVLKLFGARDVDKEYEAMKIRLQQLETANQMLLEVQAENERLNELLGFEQKFPGFEYIPARVSGKLPGNWFYYFTLNRGSNDGVEPDMTVVNGQGLVGMVIEVEPTSCKVMSIIDRTSAISVVVVHSRDQGMAHGSGDPQGADPTCDIFYLPQEAEVAPGDVVVSSDFDSKSLKGIPVGTISTVERGSNRKATLIPYVDFAHLENVLIIRKEKPVQSSVAPQPTDGSEPAAAGDGEPAGTSGGTTGPVETPGQQVEPGDKGGEGN